MNMIPVGISSCLLGNAVRYDGRHKGAQFDATLVRHAFHWQPICPEVASGMPVPRPTLGLYQHGNSVRLRENDSQRDHTDSMVAFCNDFVTAPPTIFGFVCMERSPSCGFRTTPYHSANGEHLSSNENGVFAHAIEKHFPLLPLANAQDLGTPLGCETFVNRVSVWHRWCTTVHNQCAAQRLIQFHSRVKFLALAHSQAHYRQLGPMVAGVTDRTAKERAADYMHTLMDELKRTPTTNDYVNALQHLAGMVKRSLSDPDKQILHRAIHSYETGELPLQHPFAALRQSAKSTGNAYVLQQMVLSPIPNVSDAIRDQLFKDSP